MKSSRLGRVVLGFVVVLGTACSAVHVVPLTTQEYARTARIEFLVQAPNRPYVELARLSIRKGDPDAARELEAAARDLGANAVVQFSNPMTGATGPGGRLMTDYRLDQDHYIAVRYLDAP
jgi:uncharacterized protein YbjQ (UPF0145 family)